MFLQVFSCKYREVFKNNFFERTFPVTPSEQTIKHFFALDQQGGKKSKDLLKIIQIEMQKQSP